MNILQQQARHDAFDYIAGGAETEKTMQRNVSSFDCVDIYPRVLTGVEEPDVSTSVLGIDIALPIIAAPAAAYGIAHMSAEAGTAHGVAEAAGGAPQWFQLYLAKDDKFNREIVRRAVPRNI